jgi:hypothetical protein
MISVWGAFSQLKVSPSIEALVDGGEAPEKAWVSTLRATNTKETQTQNTELSRGGSSIQGGSAAEVSADHVEQMALRVCLRMAEEAAALDGTRWDARGASLALNAAARSITRLKACQWSNQSLLSDRTSATLQRAHDVAVSALLAMCQNGDYVAQIDISVAYGALGKIGCLTQDARQLRIKLEELAASGLAEDQRGWDAMNLASFLHAMQR